MRFLALAAALITLSACAVNPDQYPVATASPQAAKTARVDDGRPAAIVRKNKITAGQLLGQNDAWLVAHLGNPTFKRADRVASLWQYKNHQCMLNVFLYADELYADKTGTAAPKRILHFDARDTNGHNTDREQCLSMLQE